MGFKCPRQLVEGVSERTQSAIGIRMLGFELFKRLDMGEDDFPFQAETVLEVIPGFLLVEVGRLE